MGPLIDHVNGSGAVTMLVRKAVLAVLAALTILSLGGCAQEQHIAANTEPQDCLVDVWLARAQPGDACNFPQVCVYLGASMPPDGCCTSYSSCPFGGLVIDYECNNPCQSCRGDSECPFGTDVCETDACVPCPRESECKSCPLGYAHVIRNGCAMCECERI